MPKYGGKQIFSHGVSPKWVKSRKRRRKKEKENKKKKKVGEKKKKSRQKQWQASLRPPPWMAHTSTPGPKRLPALLCPPPPVAHARTPGPKINNNQGPKINHNQGNLGKGPNKLEEWSDRGAISQILKY